MAETIKVVPIFALPNKRVRLVPVIKNDSFMGHKDHDGIFMFTGCSQSFVLPVSSRTGRLVEPLTDEERLYLETELKVDLNTNHKETFYNQHSINIKKTDYDINNLYKEFDLKIPMDYLDYKILLKCPTVSPTWSQRNDNPEYEWSLKELTEEFTEKIGNADLKKRAYVWYSTIEKNKQKMYDYIRVYGINMPKLATIEELQTTLYEIIESPKKLVRLIELISDIDFEHKVFIDKAIRVGEIKQVGVTKYALVSGDVIGTSLTTAVEWVKDKTNNLLVNKIRDKIDANKI